MSKRVEPELPSITPDRDQVESFKNTRTHANTKSANASNAKAPVNKQGAGTNTHPQRANSLWLILFTLLLAVILGLAITWFYQQHLKSENTMLQYQQRISQLEQQLSATGEEMGESAIAMKVRLETLSEKSEKLWLEMDKLWASAWRRNQSDIKALRSTTTKHQQQTATANKQLSSTVVAVQDLNQKITASDLKINALGDQVATFSQVNGEINKLKSALAGLNQQSLGRDNQQIEMAATVNELDTLIKLMVERIESLELKLKQTAQLTKNTPTTVQAASIND